MQFLKPFITVAAGILFSLGAKAQGWMPELSTSTTTNFSYSGEKITNFTLSSMDADWRNPGKGLSAQISYDVVMKQFMGLNAALRFAPWLQVKVGEQKHVYLNELSTSPRTLEVCGYSLGTSYLGGYTKDLCGYSTRARDWGITLNGDLIKRGDRYLLSYNIGVFNGNGFSIKDDNAAKNFTAMLLVKPTSSLAFSVGGLLGKYTVSEASGETHLGTRNRASAGVWFNNQKFIVKSEAVWGDTDGMQSLGAFLLAGWWFRSNMAIAVRGDTFLKDMSLADSRISKAEICFTQTIGPVFRYRVQYGHTFNAAPDVKDINTLTVAISMKFSTKMIKK